MGWLQKLLGYKKPTPKEIKTTYPDVEFFAPDPMSNEEYQKMRDSEVAWLESHYDFNSVTGIQSIPAKKGLPRSSTTGATGDVDYYLRKKGFEHEKNGNIDLAILCIQKSNEIRKVAHPGKYQKEDYYALPKMLARAGRIDEAYREKRLIDEYFFEKDRSDQKDRINSVLNNARDCNTDLVIMSVLGAACPLCAIYQGRVFSLSGTDKLFPKIPDEFYQYGSMHPGCGHMFYPYIHGVTDPQLAYTLSIQKAHSRRHTKNIVAYSNRPFVDDRPREDVIAAAQLAENNRIKAAQRLEIEEHMIESEAMRGIELRAFQWLQKHVSEKCPKSISSFRRMKAQNTKNYQILKSILEQNGFFL